MNTATHSRPSKKGVLSRGEGEDSGTPRGGRGSRVSALGPGHNKGREKYIYNKKKINIKGSQHGGHGPMASLFSCLLGAIFIYFIKHRTYICDRHTFY